MMEKKINKKAEDILIEENISSNLDINSLEKNQLDNSELEKASRIHSFLVSSSVVFPLTDKNQTKHKIATSVNNLKKRNLIYKWAVAASFLLICTLSGIWFWQNNSNSEIINFAQSQTNISPDKETRLILQDGQEVLIDKAESKISYNQNGEDIIIDSEKKVTQKAETSKSIFNTVIVPYGKRTELTLSDGSKVWLNSGSKLIYPIAFVGNKREVYIEGEAIFEVAHSEEKAFHVSTRDFEIKVLGTIFNVSAYTEDKYSSTVLAQGKVELSFKGNNILSREHHIITPGTLSVFDPELKSFQDQKVNPQNYMSWRCGYLIFDREKFSVILKKIARFYNVEFVLIDKNLGEETFSGNLDLRNSPEEVLEVIAQTTKIAYRYENNKLVINQK